MRQFLQVCMIGCLIGFMSRGICFHNTIMFPVDIEFRENPISFTDKVPGVRVKQQNLHPVRFI